MSQCWALKPQDRPTFQALKDFLCEVSVNVQLWPCLGINLCSWEIMKDKSTRVWQVYKVLLFTGNPERINKVINLHLQVFMFSKDSNIKNLAVLLILKKKDTKTLFLISEIFQLVVIHGINYWMYYFRCDPKTWKW